MKLFRLITTLLLLAIIALFIKQNLPTFRSTIPFSFNLYIREEVHWTHQLWTLLVTSGVIGFFVGFLLMLKPYLRLRRAVNQSTRDQKDKPIRRSLIGKTQTTSKQSGDASPSPEETKKSAENQA